MATAAPSGPRRGRYDEGMTHPTGPSTDSFPNSDSRPSSGSGPSGPGATAPNGLIRALGIASLALGIPQTLAPRRFARAIGAEDDRRTRWITQVACGPRELAVGAGILALEKPTPRRTLWARAAGDVLDLALLAAALRHRAASPARLVASTVAVVGIAAADLYAASEASKVA